MKKFMMVVGGVVVLTGCTWFSGSETSATPSNSIQITNEADFNKYLSQQGNVVVKCHATWCGPCKRMSPIDTQMAALYQGKVTFLMIDVDLNKSWVGSRLGVRGVPAYFLYKNGQLKDGWTGAVGLDAYEAIVKKNFMTEEPVKPQDEVKDDQE